MRTILVVESNRITRKVVRKTLEAEGYGVLEAPDGLTALSLLKRGSPDLVLQDFHLPDVDAVDLLAEIRGCAGGDKLPVLALSGYQSKLEEARAASVGFDDFLLKPVDPSTLLLAVQAHLPEGGAGPAPPWKGWRVLLVDDDPVQLKHGAVILRGFGFRVDTASSAEDALAKAGNVSVDAIVTDTMMPRVDGFRFCLLVRQDPRLRRVPVVIVSSVYLDEKDRELARKVGANAFVLRTPSFVEVTNALRASAEGAAPPAFGEVGPDLMEDYTHRVIQRLERQVAKNAGLAQRVSLQAMALSIVGSISEAIARPPVFQLTLDDILSQCLDAAGISRGALYQLSGQELVLSASTGYPVEAMPQVQSFFGRPDLANRILSAGSPAGIPSGTFAREEEAALLDQAGATSALIIPLLSYGERMGIFFLASEVTNLVEEHWIPFAHLMAVQVGQALALTRACTRVSSSERRYRALVESAGDAIIVANNEDVVLEANRQAEALLGMPSSEMVGRPAPDLVAPEQRHRAEALREALARDGKARATDLLMQRKDGSTVAVDLSIAVVALDGDRTRIAVLRDLTEQKMMQTQLMVSDRMASVGMIAAGVAHEINNPLAAAMANLELASQHAAEVLKRLGPVTGLDDLLAELSDAREGAERVRQILRDLKIFSRTGHMERGPVDLHPILESSLRMVWNEIRHRARLVRNFGTVPHVEGNDSRLGQVFLNLFVNAAQAIPEGRAESNEIRVSTGVDDQGRVIVEISDTGCGITPEFLGRLFTPFVTSKPPGAGTGLGLSICHRIITELGGAISVESQVDQGTTFRVLLRPASAEPVAEAGAGPSAIAATRRGRVLIVDDEPMIGRSVRRALTPEHDVAEATRAADALERIRRGERFDVILCDLMMPELTGMDLHEELKRDAPDQAARMVFLTGGAFTPRARMFLEEVPNQRIEKPFELVALRSLVNELVR